MLYSDEIHRRCPLGVFIPVWMCVCPGTHDFGPVLWLSHIAHLASCARTQMKFLIRTFLPYICWEYTLVGALLTVDQIGKVCCWNAFSHESNIARTHCRISSQRPVDSVNFGIVAPGIGSGAHVHLCMCTIPKGKWRLLASKCLWGMRPHHCAVWTGV